MKFFWSSITFFTIAFYFPSYGSQLKYQILDLYEGQSSGVAVDEEGRVLVEYGPNEVSPYGISQFMGIWNPKAKTLTQGKPLAGFTAAHPKGFNKSGEAAGFSGRADTPHFAATFWDADAKESLLPPLSGDVEALVSAMSEEIIVGFSIGQGNRPMLWERTNGKWEPKALPFKAHLTMVRGVSPNSKFIVGQDGGKPVKWEKEKSGEWKEVFLSEKYGDAFAVNDDGIIAGIFTVSKKVKNDDYSAEEAFLLSDQGFSALGFLPGHSFSHPNALNIHGIVVGNSASDNDVEPVFWRGNPKAEEVTVSMDIGEVRGINSKGQITGTAFSEGSGYKAFAAELK